jgi:hypothetical protein
VTAFFIIKKVYYYNLIFPRTHFPMTTTFFHQANTLLSAIEQTVTEAEGLAVSELQRQCLALGWQDTADRLGRQGLPAYIMCAPNIREQVKARFGAVADVLSHDFLPDGYLYFKWREAQEHQELRWRGGDGEQEQIF